jgi:PAS domain S-box-containing protein
MHRTLDKKIYAGIAAALGVFLVVAGVAIWQVSKIHEARMLGIVAVFGSMAYSVLLVFALMLMRRSLRERRENEKGLRDAEELNARMIESSPDCIALLDVSGRLKVVNSAMWKWIEDIGLQPVEDMPWVDTWVGDMRRAAESVLKSAMSGKVGRFQGLCHVRSGEGRWYDVVVTPVSDENNHPERLLVVSRDVTASHSSEEKFRVLFDNSTNAHIVFDGHQVLDCNHYALEILGFPEKSELVGLDVAALSPEQQPDGSLSEIKRTEIWQLVREIGHYRYEWQARRWTGEEFPVEIAITPVWADGREVLLAVWTDLTERRLAENLLRESEQRFEAFMDHSPTLCFIKDDQGRMLFINSVMAKAFGVSYDDMVGKNDFDWLPHETAKAVMEYDRSILETNRASKQVEMVTTSDGSTHEWLVVKFPIVAPDGRKFLGGIGIDVRDQRRAERALKLSESTFRDLFHDAPVAYHELDTEGRFTRVNKTGLAMVGYTAAEMVGRHIGEFLVGDAVRESIMRRLITGAEIDEPYQSQFRRKDGSVFPVLVRDSLIQDSAGVVFGLRSTMQDISELKRTEESLRAAEENYRKIFENAIEGIFQISPEGHFLNANPALAAILGYATPAELLANVSDIGSQIYVQPARWAEFRSVMERGASIAEFECEMHCRNGSIIWVSKHARPVRDREGKLVYYEGALENVTARRLAEAAMSDARDSALESARLKTEFLANMSHEIRTPMNGIIGMTGLLLDTNLTARQRDFADTIVDSSEALLKIINDILDFSKIEAGMLTFEEIDFDLNDVAEGVVDLFAGRALSKGIELSLIIADDVPEVFTGDPGRLRQVLANLVGNALKFTDEGEVRVMIRMESEQPGGTMLHFEVMDTGIGISIEQQARLFQAFVQADGSTTRRHGGTGLGLAISRRLVSQMGGEIWIESEPGRGSRFFFNAVFRRPQIASVRQVRKFSGIRALLVEENGGRPGVLPQLLESWGITVERAADGAEAMKALRAMDGREWQFDVVVFDVDVRCEGGVGLASAIRGDVGLAGVRLVRVVSLNNTDDSAASDDTPVDGQIAKPIKHRSVHRCMVDVLESATREAMRSVPQAALPAETHGNTALSSLRVLVAEDSVVNQKVVQFQLRKLGCKVDSVMDGEEALLAIRKSNYDVVLMDCQMPKLDGWETSRRIRQLEKDRTHRTWIVAMTAHSLVGDRERCMEAGMDDYLSKPVRFSDLAAALEQSPAGRIAVAADATHEPANVFCREKISSFRQLEKESGQTVLTSVIDLFIERTPPMFKEAKKAILSNDIQRVMRLTHTIKGSCSNFGAHRMRAACERLEKNALGDTNSGAMAEMLDEIEREFGFVRAALEIEMEAKTS